MTCRYRGWCWTKGKRLKSFESFYTEMVNLNNQQQEHYDEEKLVMLLRCNLKPALANMTFAANVRSLANFCNLARAADWQLYSQRETYQPYQQRPQAGPRIKGITYINPTEALEVDALQAGNSVVWWNCEEDGHGFRSWPKAIDHLFCFKCGLDKVLSPKCPRWLVNRLKPRAPTGEVRWVE